MLPSDRSPRTFFLLIVLGSSVCGWARPSVGRVETKEKEEKGKKEKEAKRRKGNGNIRREGNQTFATTRYLDQRMGTVFFFFGYYSAERGTET